MSKRKSKPRATTAGSPAPVVSEIRRGDILWISCDPSIGAEPRMLRTCVVVSNDLANRYGQVITVIPTQAYTAERAARAYMADLRSPRSTLTDDRVANASMVMTYDRGRVTTRAGRVSVETMRVVDAALAMHLDLRTM